jgi:hypothetical protein
MIEIDYTAGTVGIGWKNLVDPLIAQCESEGVDILQIKEKFGGLRFYVGGDATQVTLDMIYDAEAKSYQICEACGEPGIPRGGSWIKTLCDKHAGLRNL